MALHVFISVGLVLWRWRGALNEAGNNMGVAPIAWQHRYKHKLMIKATQRPHVLFALSQALPGSAAMLPPIIASFQHSSRRWFSKFFKYVMNLSLISKRVC